MENPETLITSMSELAKQWSDAFSERNGNRIYELLSEKEKKNFYQMKFVLLPTAGSSRPIGWSSPWPWEKNQKIVVEDNRAEITYYALVSDPHIYVMRENLKGVKTKDGYRVDSEEFHFYTEIKTKEEYEDAYKMGLPDYTEYSVQLQEAANRSKGSSTEKYYDVYLKPDTAMESLLNLKDGKAEIIKRKKHKTLVRYTFKDGDTVEVWMYQPEEQGKGGIWIYQ